VGLLTELLIADEDDATEDRPDMDVVECEVDKGERFDALEMSLTRPGLCCAGLFALIASANALDMYSSSVSTGTGPPAAELDRDRPGVGIPVLPGVGIPETRGLDMS
jgi:hypothetical protein